MDSNNNATCFLAVAGIQFHAAYNRSGSKEFVEVQIPF